MRYDKRSHEQWAAQFQTVAAEWHQRACQFMFEHRLRDVIYCQRKAALAHGFMWRHLWLALNCEDKR